MSNDIAKALKQKTDAMLRLQGQSQKPVVYENVDGSYTAPEKSDYTAVLAAGKNIQILTSGNIKTIHAVMGLLAGSNISISAPDPITGKVTITAIGLSLPDFMTQDADGFKIYDSAAKTNLIATIGRQIDAGLTTETSLIPAMTSSTLPSGIVTSSTEFDTTTYSKWRALNKVPTDYWSTATAVAIGWIAYEFATTKRVNKYTIQSRSDANDGSPKNWTFEGWNGSVWVILDTRANETVWTNGQKRAYTFANANSYIKYRLNVTANNGRATLNIAEIEMIDISSGGYLYGVFTEQFMKMLKGAALPVASADYRGKIFTLLGGAGVADITYICIKNATEGYEWRQI